MKALLVAGAFALLASPALAVPMCNQPMPEANGLINYGFGPETESEAAAHFEQALHAEGIDAHQTRFWNGCIQTWVNVGGQDQMRFFDPDTLAEVH